MGTLGQLHMGSLQTSLETAVEMRSDDAAPFKGKGGNGGQNTLAFRFLDQVCTHDDDPRNGLIRDADDARELLRPALAQRDELRARAKRLANDFRKRWPNSPILLKQSPDKGYVYLRWRHVELASWPRIELTSIKGQAILDVLDPPLHQAVREAELERLRTNLVLANVTYACTRLADYADQDAAIRAMDQPVPV